MKLWPLQLLCYQLIPTDTCVLYFVSQGTLPRCRSRCNIYYHQRKKPSTFNLLSHVAYLVIRTQASWYSWFILASLLSLTHNIQPITIPTNSSFLPILKSPFASTISESMMIYRLLFLAAILGIANAAESCYYCVSPILKDCVLTKINVIRWFDENLIAGQYCVNC